MSEKIIDLYGSLYINSLTQDKLREALKMLEGEQRRLFDKLPKKERESISKKSK